MKHKDERFKEMLLRDMNSAAASTSREGQIIHHQQQPPIYYMPVDVNNIKEETSELEMPENPENGDDDDDSYEGEHSIASMLDVDFSSVSPEPDQNSSKKVIVIPKSIQMKYVNHQIPYVKVQQPQHPDVLVKEELEFKINSNDADITYRKQNSNVPTWNRYMPIYYKNVRQNYVRCLECGWLVLHKTSTGTGSLLRHKCKLKNFTASSIPNTAIQITTKPEVKVQRATTKPSAVLHQSVVEDVHRQQAKFLFNDLRTAEIFDDAGFKAFAQFLLNIGSYYGLQDTAFLADKTKLLTDTIPKLYHETKNELRSTIIPENLCYSFCIWHNNIVKQDYLTLFGHVIDEGFSYKKVNLKTIPWDSIRDRIEDKFQEITKDYFEGAVLEHFTVVSTKKIINGQFENITCIVATLLKLLTLILIEFYPFITNEILENYINDIYVPEVIDFQQFLSPFRDPIRSLTQDSNTTINEVFLWKKKLERYFINLPANDEKNMKIKRLFNEQIPHILHSDFHKMAVFFDPKFKGLKFLTDDERTDVLKIVKKHLKTNPDSISDLKRQNATSSRFDWKEGEKFAEFMDVSIEVDDEDLADAEIRQYMDVKLESPIDILEYWRGESSFPLLKKLAQRVLNVPACSDEMKIKFGKESIELKKRMSILNGDELDMILYLKQNSSL